MTTKRILVDTNVLVALVDARDKWHDQAILIRDALIATDAELVYFDCVVNEAVSVIGRRAEEQKRSDQFTRLLDSLAVTVPADSITWVSASGERLYPDVLDLCRSHEGRLNFNDALIALVTQELSIPTILSFDKDFDEIDWLERLSDSSKIIRP